MDAELKNGSCILCELLKPSDKQFSYPFFTRYLMCMQLRDDINSGRYWLFIFNAGISCWLYVVLYYPLDLCEKRNAILPQKITDND